MDETKKFPGELPCKDIRKLLLMILIENLGKDVFFHVPPPP